MKILKSNEYRLYNVLPKANAGYDFRTIDEFYDLNQINPLETDEDELELYNLRYYSSNWQWNGIRERPMSAHISYIEESLKSHPAKLLIEKIREKFSDYVLECAIDNTQNDKNDVIRVLLKEDDTLANRTCVGKKTLLNTKTSGRFYNLIEFFKYYITFITSESPNTITVYIEPVYTRCVTDEFKSNGKYAYHITDVENISGIRKKGLVPKTTKVEADGTITGYRYFPERTFYIGPCETKVKTTANLKNAVGILNKLNGYAIVEVDISKLNIDFWEDRAATDIEHAAYSYTAIPKTLIKNIVTNVEQIDF